MELAHWSANSQLVNGVKGIGTNVDFDEYPTPFTPAVYYYDKIPPIDVELKVTKPDRTLQIVGLCGLVTSL